MAMEMRARESVNMSEDLTRPIAPYATALHDAFLHSHCCSCFHSLPSQSPRILSCVMCHSVRYCCSDCLSSDCEVHSSSGECCLFVNHLKKANPSYITEEKSDIRAALRLLYLLEMHGLVSSDLTNHSNRIGGLSACGIGEVLEEGGEIADRILEGSLLISSARKLRAQISVGLSNVLTVERVALWAVITNSVEVQVSEGQALGIAVYGPSFSWFNHSCCPNASYRFVLPSWNEDCISCKSESCVVPASKGVAQDALHAWRYEADGSSHAPCKYGPRVIVRCIKPINRGDEVCITYIDLLQTKEARYSDLWSKYKFICSCKRCTASPESYVDVILNCDARNLNSPEDTVTSPAIEDLDGILQQAISEYSLGDDPKACCDMIESMLAENLLSDLQQEELSQRKYMLHPLHHICLNAYMTLASAYRFRALKLNSNSLHGGDSGAFFRMTKVAAAYSFVLAGATHHLFLSECSFMTSLSHFLLSTGQFMLDFVECIKGETRTNVSEAKFSFASCSASSANRDSMQFHQFRATCEEFGKHMLSLSLQCWPYLAQSLPCLEKIKNPVDFSWLGTAIFQFLHLCEEGSANISCTDGPAALIEEQKCILSLAICCITYGKYLASICYGPQHYLVDHAKDLLEGMSIVPSAPEKCASKWMVVASDVSKHSFMQLQFMLYFHVSKLRRSETSMIAAAMEGQAPMMMKAGTTRPATKTMAAAVTTTAVVQAASTNPATTTMMVDIRTPTPTTTVAVVATTSPAQTIPVVATTNLAPMTTAAVAATSPPLMTMAADTRTPAPATTVVMTTTRRQAQTATMLATRTPALMMPMAEAASTSRAPRTTAVVRTPPTLMTMVAVITTSQALTTTAVATTSQARTTTIVATTSPAPMSMAAVGTTSPTPMSTLAATTSPTPMSILPEQEGLI